MQRGKLFPYHLTHQSGLICIKILGCISEEQILLDSIQAYVPEIYFESTARHNFHLINLLMKDTYTEAFHFSDKFEVTKYLTSLLCVISPRPSINLRVVH